MDIVPSNVGVNQGRLAAKQALKPHGLAKIASRNNNWRMQFFKAKPSAFRAVGSICTHKCEKMLGIACHHLLRKCDNEGKA